MPCGAELRSRDDTPFARRPVIGVIKHKKDPNNASITLKSRSFRKWGPMKIKVLELVLVWNTDFHPFELVR